VQACHLPSAPALAEEKLSGANYSADTLPAAADAAAVMGVSASNFWDGRDSDCLERILSGAYIELLRCICCGCELARLHRGAAAPKALGRLLSCSLA
jgi:hypothetical protein